MSEEKKRVMEFVSYGSNKITVKWLLKFFKEWEEVTAELRKKLEEIRSSRTYEGEQSEVDVNRG